jgi:ring-1,2-phenylacetyl-CoA epoxidase subunit PaaC
VSEALAAVAVALADDELVIGHRHSEWTGFAPHIEEDVAFSSIAQDEIGHAAALYALEGSLVGRDPDALAFGRDPTEYRHAILCERPNGDWAYTLARHWLYDTADDLRLGALESTASDSLRALATKMRREERYHLLHASTWLKRVAQGPIEGRTRIVEALAAAYRDALALFEPLEEEEEAVRAGWLTEPSAELRVRFARRASGELDQLGLPTDIGAVADEAAEFVASSSGDLLATGHAAPHEPVEVSGAGGRRGRHSADFTALWDEMTETYRVSPGASW